MENGYRPLMERKIFNRCERNLLLLVRGISTLTNKRGEKEYLHHQTEFRMEIESEFIFRMFLPEFKNARLRQCHVSLKREWGEKGNYASPSNAEWRSKAKTVPRFTDDDDIVIISSSYIFIFFIPATLYNSQFTVSQFVLTATVLCLSLPYRQSLRNISIHTVL